MTIRLADFDAVTFDVYGTLIDWEPSIIQFLTGWAERHSISAQPADLLMAFDAARADIQRHRPAYLYPDVLRRCFDCISATYELPIAPDERETFARAPHAWPPFPDSHSGLKALQQRVKIGALSNIDEASLAASCRQMDIAFDLVVTAERVGAYKPDWPHFTTALAELDRMGIAKSRVLHVGQSLRADIVPANTLGLTCAWVNRPNRVLGLTGDGSAGAKPDIVASSLAELLVALHA